MNESTQTKPVRILSDLEERHTGLRANRNDVSSIRAGASRPISTSSNGRVNRTPNVPIDYAKLGQRFRGQAQEMIRRVEVDWYGMMIYMMIACAIFGVGIVVR